MGAHMHYDAADLQAVKSFNWEPGQLREDGIFLARQLDFVKSRVYETEQPALTGLTLVPVSTEVPAWAESFTSRTYDDVGIAKFISNYADDLPRVDVQGQEETQKLKSLGDSYGYSIDELRLSQALGNDLSVRKGRVARRAIDQKINRVALVGDSRYGFYGISNHPNIGETAINGDWTSSDTTVGQIIDDLDAMYDAVTIQSYQNHTPNTLAVSPTRASALRKRRQVGTSGEYQSAWSLWSADHPGVTLIPATELEGNDDVEPQAIMYERDVDNLSIEIPRPFEQLPAEKRNLEMVIDCLAKVSGVVVYRPLALTKGVGV